MRPTLKPGDAIYFKRCKESARSTAGEIQFKGHGIGVLLGYLPPAARDLTPAMLMRLMGQLGYMTFDDIAEFLTPADAETCVKKYEDKYYGKEVEGPFPGATEGVPEIQPDPETSPILTASGRPQLTPVPSPSTDVADQNTSQGSENDQTH